VTSNGLDHCGRDASAIREQALVCSAEPPHPSLVTTTPSSSRGGTGARKRLEGSMGAPASYYSIARHPKHQLVVYLTENQRRVVFETVRRIKAYSSTRSMAVAILHACEEYVGGPNPPASLQDGSKSRRPLRFGIYEDDIEFYELALAEAKAHGCTDDGWALTEICASVMAPGGTCSKMAGWLRPGLA